jgi:ribonuclease P protein component
MRAATDFSSVMRRGTASGRTTVVVHAGRIEGSRRVVGFAVSRAVGNAVTRNAIKRRLRAIIAEILPTLPVGTGLVIRALPCAAMASFAELSTDVHEATMACMEKGLS